MGDKMKINTSIEDLFLFKLGQIFDERGAVFHYLKINDDAYHDFGESYFSIINPNVIKGWKLHKNGHQNFCVPHGKIKIVLFDNRKKSLTQGNWEELVLDDNENYFLLSVPPGLWYSFKGISSYPSILANTLNIPHNDLESSSLPLKNDLLRYEWN